MRRNENRVASLVVPFALALSFVAVMFACAGRAEAKEEKTTPPAAATTPAPPATPGAPAMPAASAAPAMSTPAPYGMPALTASGDAPIFERLKTLEGTWVGKAGFGEPTDPMTATYEVTAGGNVLMETLFGGTDHEMVTMYHLDGPRLVLTHYCTTGNQPRMRSVASTASDTYAFDFLDATNLASPNAAHMHSAWLRFVDADHIESGWTMFEDGKASGEARFDLARKK